MCVCVHVCVFMYAFACMYVCTCAIVNVHVYVCVQSSNVGWSFRNIITEYHWLAFPLEMYSKFVLPSNLLGHMIKLHL